MTTDPTTKSCVHDPIQVMPILAVAWNFQQCGILTSKGSDQPAHMRSLIRAFASRLYIL